MSEKNDLKEKLLTTQKLKEEENKDSSEILQKPLEFSSLEKEDYDTLQPAMHFFEF